MIIFYNPCITIQLPIREDKMGCQQVCNVHPSNDFKSNIISFLIPSNITIQRIDRIIKYMTNQYISI